MNGIGEDLDNYTELEKFGRLTYSREQEDLSCVISQVKAGTLPFSTYMDTDRIGLFGHSRGGGNSILFALDSSSIRAVVVWNSIHRVNFFDETVIEEIKRNGIGYITHARTGQQLPISREVVEDIETHQERFNILSRLPELGCPLLIVQGNQDHPRLVEGASWMAQSTPKATLYTVAGANHTMGMKHPTTTTTTHFEQAMNETIKFYHAHLNDEQKHRVPTP
jgi:pimeloyl-ACP methyl ester carboxylesterase